MFPIVHGTFKKKKYIVLTCKRRTKKLHSNDFPNDSVKLLLYMAGVTVP